MTKFEQLDSMLEQGNGYITTRAVTAQGISKALPQKPLQPALRKQTQALAGAVSMERLLAVYDFIDVLIDRLSRNAASAAVTCSLTSDIYRICYAS